MGSKGDLYYIRQALDDMDVIISYTLHLSYDEFVSDGRTLDATMFRLQQLIEKSNRSQARSNGSSLTYLGVKSLGSGMELSTPTERLI